jgi:indole-3-acetate monooxygenase
MSSRFSSVQTSDFIRGRAETLASLVREESASSERLGRLTDKVASSLLEEKLFSILLPQSEGGLGGTRRDLYEAAETLARADGSTGWCLSLCNSVNYVAWRGLTAEGRSDVFENGPVACWTCLIPDAVSIAAPGGYRITGKWTYVSGSSFARWALVTSASKTAGGQTIYRAHLVPKDDVEIMEGAWRAMGLRATSCVDYSITDKFVPVHRTYSFPSDGSAPAGPLSALESIRLNQIGLTAFACGVGQRALQELIVPAPKTKRLAAEGTQSNDNIVQFGVGELEARMRSARSYFLELLTRQDEVLAQGGQIAPVVGLEISQAAQILSRTARDIAVFAFDNSGTSVVYESNPIQRCFRDIFTGLKHGSFTPAILGRIGKVRLGLDYGPRAF